MNWNLMAGSSLLLTAGLIFLALIFRMLINGMPYDEWVRLQKERRPLKK